MNTSSLSLRRLRQIFDAAPRTTSKGFTWSFLHHQEHLYQWLWFQRHKYDDAFTVELSWNCLTDEPTRPPFRDPADSFSPEGARMRLGAFWNNGGDYWWYVADAPPGILDVPPEEWLKRLAMPQVVDLNKTLPRLHRAVDDAIGRIRDYALPYFSRVGAWAREHSCEPVASPNGAPAECPGNPDVAGGPPRVR